MNGYESSLAVALVNAGCLSDRVRTDGNERGKHVNRDVVDCGLRGVGREHVAIICRYVCIIHSEVGSARWYVLFDMYECMKEERR